MNRHILKQNNDYSFIGDYTILNTLPKAVYQLDWNGFGNCILHHISDDFQIPTPLFDIDKQFRSIILKSFNTYNKNLGVCLLGQKGTGKSVTAKLLANETGLPVIIINKAVPKNINFIDYLNKYQDSFVLFIDEFEKLFKECNYDSENNFYTQEDLLSFLDGFNFNSKKMFLFTSNSELSDFYQNRPSRIKFSKEYKGISLELGNQIIQKTLVYPEFAEDLIENLDKENCTIDILLCIIEEINVQNLPYSEFKSFFNFKKNRFSDIVNVYKKEGSEWVLTNLELSDDIKDYFRENKSPGNSYLFNDGNYYTRKSINPLIYEHTNEKTTNVYKLEFLSTKFTY